MQGIRIKKLENRKAIVTREEMILDNYGCMQGRTTSGNGKRAGKAGLTEKAKRKGR